MNQQPDINPVESTPADPYPVTALPDVAALDATPTPAAPATELGSCASGVFDGAALDVLPAEADVVGDLPEAAASHEATPPQFLLIDAWRNGTANAFDSELAPTAQAAPPPVSVEASSVQPPPELSPAVLAPADATAASALPDVAALDAAPTEAMPATELPSCAPAFSESVDIEELPAATAPLAATQSLDIEAAHVQTAVSVAAPASARAAQPAAPDEPAVDAAAATVRRGIARLIEYTRERHIALPPRTTIELIEHPSIIEVPGAAAYAYGLMAWQGSWLPVIDLALLLHGPSQLQRTLSAPRYALVLAYQPAPRQPLAHGAIGMGFLPQFTAVTDDLQCEWPDDNARWPQLALSCFRYEERAVPILDTSRLFAGYHPPLVPAQATQV